MGAGMGARAGRGVGREQHVMSSGRQGRCFWLLCIQKKPLTSLTI